MIAGLLLAFSPLAAAEGVESPSYWTLPDGSIAQVKHRGTTFGDRHVKGRGVTRTGEPTTEWSDPHASGTPDGGGEVIESGRFKVGDTTCRIDEDAHRDDSSLYALVDGEWVRCERTKVGEGSGREVLSPPGASWTPPPAPPDERSLRGDPDTQGGLPVPGAATRGAPSNVY